MGLKVDADGEEGSEEEEEEYEDELLDRQNIDPDDLPGNPIMQGSLNLGAQRRSRDSAEFFGSQQNSPARSF